MLEDIVAPIVDEERRNDKEENRNVSRKGEKKKDKEYRVREERCTCTDIY